MDDKRGKTGEAKFCPVNRRGWSWHDWNTQFKQPGLHPLIWVPQHFISFVISEPCCKRQINISVFTEDDPKHKGTKEQMIKGCPQS